MANFLLCRDNYKITITGWKDIENATYYSIQVEIVDVKWTVNRRYSEFAKLHKSLVTEHGITSDILPPKKTIGNKDERFIEKRRNSLEKYIVTVVRFLQKTVPKDLAYFLNFNKYDINFVVKNLAVKFYKHGETILFQGKGHTFTPLEVFAINETLKHPRSSLDLRDQQEDFSHVLDFCLQLPELNITGSEEPLLDTNIIPNDLPLQLSIFRTLYTLTLNNINCNTITDLGSLRYTLGHLTVNQCKLQTLTDVFLCDQTHKTDVSQQNKWTSLTQVKVCNTMIANIDNSVQLAPNLKTLILNNNQITQIVNLNYLTELTSLTMKKNCLSMIDYLEANRLVSLDLSENHITTMKPFIKLGALETLNLQMNYIGDVTEVRHIADLPNLENLVLTGNPVSQIVDYRVKVLVYFGNRAFRICLDNENTNQKELDKVAILKALHSTKQGLTSLEVPP